MNIEINIPQIEKCERQIGIRLRESTFQTLRSKVRSEGKEGRGIDTSKLIRAILEAWAREQTEITNTK